ncbi:integumentary mucin A.1-like [Ambystoma mexicanum]|uniref:integumentary mucin A.1-like n=1 Tax=Ambystoma mexicanum TaxID=8296 RepID=UPI0037E87CC4
MGRARGLLPLLGWLVLAAVRAGAAVETTDGGIHASTGPVLPASFEDPTGVTMPLQTQTLSGTLQPSTNIPTEQDRLQSQSMFQVDNGSMPDSTWAPGSEDTSADGHRNSTASTVPDPTLEGVLEDLNSTVEGAQPTYNASLQTGEGTATLGVPQTETTPPTTTPVPVGQQGNVTGETTQDLVESGVTTTQNVTTLNSTTMVIVAMDTVATTVDTSTATTVTALYSTTHVPKAATSNVASEDGWQEPSVLDVGDDGKDVPGVTNRVLSNTDPLVVAVISVFIIMIGILALVGFLRYRQRNSRTEFRRLQDLPMDDMMEDTPLSLYSY